MNNLHEAIAHWWEIQKVRSCTDRGQDTSSLDDLIDCIIVNEVLSYNEARELRRFAMNLLNDHPKHAQWLVHQEKYGSLL